MIEKTSSKTASSIKRLFLVVLISFIFVTCKNKKEKEPSSSAVGQKKQALSTKKTVSNEPHHIPKQTTFPKSSPSLHPAHKPPHPRPKYTVQTLHDFAQLGKGEPRVCKKVKVYGDDRPRIISFFYIPDDPCSIRFLGTKLNILQHRRVNRSKEELATVSKQLEEERRQRKMTTITTRKKHWVIEENGYSVLEDGRRLINSDGKIVWERKTSVYDLPYVTYWRNPTNWKLYTSLDYQKTIVFNHHKGKVFLSLYDREGQCIKKEKEKMATIGFTAATHLRKEFAYSIIKVKYNKEKRTRSSRPGMPIYTRYDSIIRRRMYDMKVLWKYRYNGETKALAVSKKYTAFISSSTSNNFPYKEEDKSTLIILDHQGKVLWKKDVRYKYRPEVAFWPNESRLIFDGILYDAATGKTLADRIGQIYNRTPSGKFGFAGADGVIFPNGTSKRLFPGSFGAHVWISGCSIITDYLPSPISFNPTAGSIVRLTSPKLQRFLCPKEEKK